MLAFRVLLSASPIAQSRGTPSDNVSDSAFNRSFGMLQLSSSASDDEFSGMPANTLWGPGHHPRGSLLHSNLKARMACIRIPISEFHGTARIPSMSLVRVPVSLTRGVPPDIRRPCFDRQSCASSDDHRL